MMDRGQQCWVVFTGKADLWWLKALRPGFRHCYVLVKDKGNWITIDPLSNHIDIEIQPVSGDFDLPLHFQKQGMIVVRADINRSQNCPAPVMFFSCVEAVKRFLGLHKRWIVTPYQLYRSLIQAEFSSRKNLTI